MMIVNKKIGDMTKSELKDFIIELQEENSKYERINQKYKEVIDKAINYIYDEIKREGFLHHYLNDKDIEEILDILKGVK